MQCMRSRRGLRGVNGQVEEAKDLLVDTGPTVLIIHEGDLAPLLCSRGRRCHHRHHGPATPGYGPEAANAQAVLSNGTLYRSLALRAAPYTGQGSHPVSGAVHRARSLRCELHCTGCTESARCTRKDSAGRRGIGGIFTGRSIDSVEMADPWEECMDFAVQIARKAGAMVCAALKEEVSVMLKSSPADLVTATDQKVEEMLISLIKEKYPSHCFIGEESVAAGKGSTLTDSPTWIIDPIDGTTNFVHRFPFVAISIGFAVNKQVEFGIVYSCVEDKMYTGRRGKGSFCNGQKLQVSGQKDITKSMIITELGSNRNPEIIKIVMSNMERLLCIPIHGIRAVGTAAVNMCLVAAGGADAYYEMGIHCWDMAAASIIVTEAGGVVLDAKGGHFDLMSCRVIAASSKEIGERIAKELQIVPVQRDDGKKNE